MTKSIWCDRTLVYLNAQFGLCTTEAMFHRELKRLDVPRDNWPPYVSTPQANATAHFFVRSSGHEACIVTMKGWEGKDPIVIAGLLVHEAVHIWQNHCEDIGEKTPSNEFEAYSIQWISQELMWRFTEQTNATPPGAIGGTGEK